MLDAQHVISGSVLHIYFLIGDPRCTAYDGMIEWCEKQKNREDAAQNLFEILNYISDHGSRTKSDWYEPMPGHDRVWAVRKAKLRLYGFVAGDCLYLCTHDAHKNQNRADRRILERTERLREEWDAQWDPR